MKENRRCSILFPLAGAGQQVADHMSRPSFVGQLLQFAFPQPGPRAVAAAAPRPSQAFAGAGVAVISNRLALGNATARG